LCIRAEPRLWRVNCLTRGRPVTSVSCWRGLGNRRWWPCWRNGPGWHCRVVQRAGQKMGVGRSTARLPAASYI